MQLAQSHAPGEDPVQTEAAAQLVLQAAGSLQDVAAHLRRGRHAALRPSDVLVPLTSGALPAPLGIQGNRNVPRSLGKNPSGSMPRLLHAAFNL